MNVYLAEFVGTALLILLNPIRRSGMNSALRRDVLGSEARA